MLPVLDIRQFSVAFQANEQSIPVVQDVSLMMQRGQLTALVGESGSGKSMTALALMGLLPKQALTQGSIYFSSNGRQPVSLTEFTVADWQMYRRTQTGMIFQEPMTALNPLLTCGEQLIERIRAAEKKSRREAQSIALHWFEKVVLPDPAAMLNRYPHELSGGQKQRVMIAMALCTRPALLIADEPTTALDVRVQAEILQLLRSLQLESQTAVLLITHDLGIVADIADSIAVMQKGRLVESGEARLVLTHPQHPYTKALLACRTTGQPKNKPLPIISDFLNDSGIPSKVTAPAPLPVYSESGPMLQVSELVVQLPDGWKPKTIVNDVSFSVQPGEIVGLVGESGCGKTTVAKAILGLMAPAKGSISFRGRMMQQFTQAEWKGYRQQVQVVFQDPYGSLNPRMRIGDAIAEPIQVHQPGISRSEAQKQARDLLETVQLPASVYHRYPHEFSGGQRQRIGIARALSTRPSLLLFDESVSALDISIQAQMLNLINELKYQQGLTALFISHDLSVVHYIADRILVMQAGAIVESGDSDQIMHRPAHPYTQALMAAIPGRSLHQ